MQLKLDSSLPLSRLCCMICLFHNILFQYISLVGYSLVCPFQFFTDDTWWFIHDTFPPSCKECLAKLTSESYRSICNVVIHGPNLTFLSIEGFHHQIISLFSGNNNNNDNKNNNNNNQYPQSALYKPKWLFEALVRNVWKACSLNFFFTPSNYCYNTSTFSLGNCNFFILKTQI